MSGNSGDAGIASTTPFSSRQRPAWPGHERGGQQAEQHDGQRHANPSERRTRRGQHRPAARRPRPSTTGNATRPRKAGQHTSTPPSPVPPTGRLRSPDRLPIRLQPSLSQRRQRNRRQPLAAIDARVADAAPAAGRRTAARRPAPAAANSSIMSSPCPPSRNSSPSQQAQQHRRPHQRPHCRAARRDAGWAQPARRQGRARPVSAPKPPSPSSPFHQRRTAGQRQPGREQQRRRQRQPHHPAQRAPPPPPRPACQPENSVSAASPSASGRDDDAGEARDRQQQRHAPGTMASRNDKTAASRFVAAGQQGDGEGDHQQQGRLGQQPPGECYGWPPTRRVRCPASIAASAMMKRARPSEQPAITIRSAHRRRGHAQG